MRSPSLLLLPLMLAWCAGSRAHADESDASVASLQRTVAQHFAAIERRDLGALLATVTEQEQLMLVLPNGEVLDTRQQYVDLHREWFAESDWRMQFELLSLRVTGSSGVVVTKYRSQALDESGTFQTRRVAILTLLFSRENGHWRLIHDQNTVVGE